MTAKINPQRGIFKPCEMAWLLSVKTVFPRPGARDWYNDQKEPHRQIYAGDDVVEYAFMGTDPTAADNRFAPAPKANSLSGAKAWPAVISGSLN